MTETIAHVDVTNLIELYLLSLKREYAKLTVCVVGLLFLSFASQVANSVAHAGGLRGVCQQERHRPAQEHSGFARASRLCEASSRAAGTGCCCCCGRYQDKPGRRCRQKYAGRGWVMPVRLLQKSMSNEALCR